MEDRDKKTSEDQCVQSFARAKPSLIHTFDGREKTERIDLEMLVEDSSRRLSR
jgi:hypothetical protein